jgi:hypothetical protein
MIRVVYIDEAEQKLKSEQPDKKASLTKLALLTGLDTRTLNKLLEEMEQIPSLSKDEGFFKGFSPGFRVLDTWLNDERYRDSSSGKPLEIALSGVEKSFEELFIQSVPARGITAQSVLHRLAENKMVTINKKKSTVRMNQEEIIFVGREELDIIDIGFWSVANLISTVITNAEAKKQKDKFFQRSCWTYKLDLKDLSKFRAHMGEFLRKANIKAGKNIALFETPESASEKFTAGISMFYFEDDAMQ